MKEKLIELLKLDPNSTEEQILARVAEVQSQNKSLKALKFRGVELSDEQQASVLRRQAAGLSLDDAIAAELAQAKHDEEMAKADKKGKGAKAAAIIVALFLSLFFGGSVQAQQSAGVIVIPQYTNTCSAFSTNTAPNTPTNPQGFQITPGNNVTIYASVTTTNAGAPNCYFGFQTSLDSTNWTSLASYTGSMALQGSNTTATSAFTFTNVPANYMRWYSFGNGQTAAVAIATMQAINK